MLQVYYIVMLYVTSYVVCYNVMLYVTKICCVLRTWNYQLLVCCTNNVAMFARLSVVYCKIASDGLEC